MISGPSTLRLGGPCTGPSVTVTDFFGIKILFKKDGLFGFLLVNAFIFDFGSSVCRRFYVTPV